MKFLEQWEKFAKDADVEWKVQGKPQLLHLCQLCYYFGLTTSLKLLDDCGDLEEVHRELRLYEEDRSYTAKRDNSQ